MNLRAITFDFWDTLFPRLGRDTDRGVAEVRSEAIRAFMAERDGVFSLEQCRAAYDAADRGHLDHWLSGMRQPAVDEALDAISGELSVKLERKERSELASRLQCRPEVERIEPFPGIKELLPALAGRFRLGIISDTWLTPGTVPRLMLERHGLLGWFSAFVFSDESGFLKPHERPFQLALAALDVAPEETVHVGDSERRDVVGALDQGMTAVLLDWNGQHDASRAHAVIRDFPALGPALEQLAARLQAAPRPREPAENK
jgi:putative hydrolase of the HAD superfamily